MSKPLPILRNAILGALVLATCTAQAQNIGINANGATPNASAMLDIDVSAIIGTKRGLLIPRVTSAERTAIVTPATGLLVYDTTTDGFWYFNGTVWTPFVSGSPGWSLTGNAGTVAGTNFLGTTDAVPFEVRVNGARSGYLAPANTNTGWGYQALLSLTGTGNTATGYQALQTSFSNANTANGYRAMRWNTTGTDNCALGYLALEANTNGWGNSAFGAYALNANTLGNNHIAIGAAALRLNTTGIGNSALGYWAMQANTTGSDNVAIGRYTMSNNTTGSNNTACGTSALQWNNGSVNTATGYEALRSNTTGSNNTACGAYALSWNTTGIQNTSTGSGAMRWNTTGNQNCAVGYQALQTNTSGWRNAAFGYWALYFNTTGDRNTAIGSTALGNNTTGFGNSALGSSALQSNTSGLDNVAIGNGALGSNTTGSDNTACGAYALNWNTTGIQNTSTGYGAMRWNSSGIQNTGTGFGALENNSIGTGNAAFGVYAMRFNTTGNNNSALGAYALQNNTTGSGNMALGHLANVVTGGLTNATAIGSNALVATSNSIVLGGTGATAANVGMGTSSPTRGKLQVEGMVGNTVGYFSGGAGAAAQGISLVANWPGVYFNCYANGTSAATMANSGYPALIYANQSAGGIAFQTTTTPNTTANTPVTLFDRMYIAPNGNVSIGPITAAYLFEVNGAAAKPGGGLWTASSDARLKKDVSDYTDGLSQLLKIRPVRFHYNELSKYDTVPEYVGVIAQELKEIAPYMVGQFQKDSVTYLDVDNSAMIYMLVNGMKEQQAMIETLQQRIAQLEASSSHPRSAAAIMR